MARPPALAVIRRWDAAELTAAASVWTSTAELWESTFTELADRIALPWEGSAAQRARRRARGDRLDALAEADRLHAAAAIARTGALRIAAARTAVLEAADDAVAAGFTVGEDFNVATTDPERIAESRERAAILSTRLNRLLDADRQLASDITNAATGLSNEIPETGGRRQSPPPTPEPSAGPLPEDPQQFAEVWNSLTPPEKDLAFQADDSIGNHGGMPVGERDVFNRRRLDRLREETATEVDGLQERFDDLAARLYMGDHSGPTTGEMHDLSTRLNDARRRLDGYESVRQALDHQDYVPRLLGFIDENGHAAVSLGDPDRASRTAVFVPGTGQDTTTLEDNTRRAMDMFNAALVADPTLTKSDVSVTTWVGYNRPMTLTEAAWPDRARDGGAALDRYLDGMHASHRGPPAVDTIVGHSYGSTLVGAAATGGHHLGADNVIAVGSPGMLSRYADDLDLDPGARVYSMTAGNDPISLVTSLTLGADPNSADYGATRLATDPGPSLPYSAGLLPGVPAHSSYWDEGNPGLANMGAVIAGLQPVALAR